MKHSKTLQGVIIGSLFTSIALGVTAYFIVTFDNSVGDFGLKPSDFWWLASILGFILGAVFGGLCGGIIGSLRLNLIKGLLLGLISSIFVVLLFAIWTGGGGMMLRRTFLLHL